MGLQTRYSLRVRQPPGDGNALGRVKFLFPNSHDIYMHDTPAKELFAEPVRAFSHGCVRVENPRELAEHVLGWERKRIDDMIATGQNRDISSIRHIPVHLNYFTAWPDKSGKLSSIPTSTIATPGLKKRSTPSRSPATELWLTVGQVTPLNGC